MNTESWDRIARSASADSLPPADTALYGPGGPTERELRLVGDVKGKRVLELGCGNAHASIAFAKQGATAIAIDASAAQLANGRRHADAEETKVEFHQCDVADLAFLRADSIDVVFSAYTLGEVDDINRVFRQVHRVLRHHAIFVFSYRHPFAALTGRDAPIGGPSAGGTAALPLGNLVVTRSYFEADPVTLDVDGHPVTTYPRTIGEVFAALGRAGFDVDAIIEPRAGDDVDRARALPETIVWRARKEGV